MKDYHKLSFISGHTFGGWGSGIGDREYLLGVRDAGYETFDGVAGLGSEGIFGVALSALSAIGDYRGLQHLSAPDYGLSGHPNLGYR